MEKNVTAKQDNFTLPPPAESESEENLNEKS
jgi:hypothetical protein